MLRSRLATAAVALIATAATLVVPQAARADAAGKGGDYVPFTSSKIVLDSRNGVGTPVGVKGAGSVTTFQVLGVNGIPASGVSGLVLRVGAFTPSAQTYFKVYPNGSPRPGTAALNLPQGQSISNFSFVQPGANGKLDLYNSAGTTHVFVEVQGYFTSAPSGTSGGLVPVTQVRAVDTTRGTGTDKVKIRAKSTRTVTLTAGGVPADATAINAHVTVPATTEAGYLSATPVGRATGVVIANYGKNMHSSSGAVIQLGTNGQVTFTNGGTADIDLVVDTMAYFTKAPNVGAGFRPLVNRVFGQLVPKDGTVDVVVGGTSGMPTKGVAGVALSFEASGTAHATLSAWPLGTTQPGIALTQHQPGTHQRSSAIIKPGVDGKIRISNNSDSATFVYVDVEGWFAEPLPVLPVAQNTPISVAQAAPVAGQGAGTVEYAYVDNIGRVVIGHQTQLDNFCCVQFTPISGNEAFTGQPSLVARPDGTVQVSAQYADGGDVWTSAQTAPKASSWTSFTDIGGSPAAPPATVQLGTGVTTQFGVDADGKLWTYAQTGAVPFWRGLGGTGLTGTPVLTTVRDGVQLFLRTTTGTITTATYRTDGSLSAWTDLGGDGTGAPAVVLYPGYRLRVFARAADGTIVTKLQDTTGTFPQTWDTLGTFVSPGNPAAMIDPVSGLTVVIARAGDGIIHKAVETGQGSGVFKDWTFAQVDQPAPAAATDPTFATINNGSGQTTFFVYRTVNGTPIFAV
ncbi:hypothetical protein UK23_21425 [Lentzea aerocolonigenes]|uniref:PLL-like beta propeller domain-containing protein n=1 Tax=Lentzea aerocolonigenes TaxID=68170 RepID=A0A0F0GUD2_LENAE|nr:hypothetical protein [Lentzea aerocolonigenes]KJK47074.1 hypothetical protein UK23_21425 [Lentzea aerocolonigenes]